MSRGRRSPFHQEFKVAAVERMLAGENVCALARELGVSRKVLYDWRERQRVSGASGLIPRRPGPRRKSERALAVAGSMTPATASPPDGPPPDGPPPDGPPPDGPPPGGSPPGGSPPGALRAAEARIAELERKVGRQALELDFFRRALRHFRKARQPDDGHGVTASTRSFER